MKGPTVIFLIVLVACGMAASDVTHLIVAHRSSRMTVHDKLLLRHWVNLDLNTPAGRLRAHVLASVACYELEVKTERQLAGIEAARAANSGCCPWCGRKAGTRVKVTEEVETAIHEMARAGKSIAEMPGSSRSAEPTVYATLNRSKVPA